MVFRLAVAIAVLGVPLRAHAEPCAVAGDPELAQAVADALAARGAACVPARIARADAGIVVATDGPDGAPLERVVGDVATAATVIESWGSAQVAAPLLAVRDIPASDVVAPSVEPAVRAQVVTRTVPRGFEMFAAVEISHGSDGTQWVGPEVGACVMLGPICGAARLRFGAVIAGWPSGLDRKETELLVGGDVPVRLGRATLSPGFGGGIGMIRTHVEDDDHDVHMSSSTGGLRADAHAALSYPVGRGLALDVTVAFDITEATHVETNTARPFPDEPWLLARFGVGLRYGGAQP